MKTKACSNPNCEFQDDSQADPVHQPVANFSLCNGRYQSRCKACCRLDHQGWQKKQTKEQIKNAGLKHKYGITLLEFQLMLFRQDNKCAICKADNPGTRYGWSVDHDHKTGKVRGVLCWHCNTILLPTLEYYSHLFETAREYLSETP